MDEFLKLKEVWNNLNLASENPLIFNTFEWQFNCFRYFKKRDSIFILLVYCDKELLAIAPLVVSNVLRASLKKIEFIGDDASDALDFIIKKGKEDVVINCLKNYLLENKKYWDLIDLYPLPENSPLLKKFNFNYPDAFLHQENIDISPVISLPSTYEEYSASLSKKFRLNLRYYLKTLNKHHKVHFGKVDALKDVEEKMRELFYLHQLRWKSKNLPGVLVGRTKKNFHLQTAQDLFKNGNLYLAYLSVDDRTISILYGLVFLDKFYFYLGGFSPKFSRYSPGNLLINFCIQDAISQNLKKFDFLKGKEQYKYRFKAQDYMLWRMYIGWRTSKSKILHLLVNMEKKVIKTIKEAIR